ncbi:MAG: S-layer homology domain-containing protein [Firmicutes bacterium]|jgi:hypothetical protein|nr:S-layer homology domain-containing protein [Bacillota bacterium]
MRLFRKSLCIAAVLSMVVGLVGGTAAARPGNPWDSGLKLGVLKKAFIDEDEAPWAVGYMAKMKLKGIMQGYPGGKFMPNSPVSRVELVVLAVRAKGLEEEARQRNGAVLPFGDAENIYRKYPWAVGYLATAVSAGLIPSGSAPFQPEKPATRLWTAEVLIRAMGLEDEAEEAMDADLPYTDAGEIPDDKVGYVAVALERGIMMGYGTTFRPFAPIRRCEVAAVLDRMEESLPPLGYEVRGVITGINRTKPAVTMRVYDKKWWSFGTLVRSALTGNVFTGTVTIPVSEDVLVLIDKRVSEFEDLEIGFRATVLRNSDGVAVLIDANSGGATPNWPVPGTATKEGSVEDITLGTSPKITIEDEDGTEWTYSIAPNCAVYMDDEEIDLEDVEEGDWVTLRIVDSKVTRIVVEEEEETVESEKDGEVTEIRTTTSPKRITIRLAGGSTFTAAISADVVVKEGGRTASLDDVSVGDDVHLHLRDGYVVRIEIEEPAATEYEGVVTSVYASGSRRITIRLDDGRTMSVAVASGVVVKYDGAAAKLSDVRVGDSVKITVTGSQVTRIDIERRTVTERRGTVTQVETGTSARIWIRLSGGSVESYQVASNPHVEYKGEDLKLDDVVPGDRVKLAISDSKVGEILIEERPVFETSGTITAVGSSSTEGRTITIKESSGNQPTYKVSADAAIKEGTQTISFNDLEQGDKVTLRVEGNLVTRITVTG